LRMLRDEVTVEGLQLRRIRDLPLVREQQPAFFIGWLLMHVIDDSSPLRDETEASLRQTGTAFILSVSGTDETTGHTLMARQQYSSDAVVWNKSFQDILEVGEDGVIHIDYTKFHDVEDLPSGVA